MLTIYHDRPDEFWLWMGPLFASRPVRKELPWLCDEPGRVWFLIVEEDQVRAFASVDVDAKGVGHLRNLWVHPDHRGNGYASQLMAERIAYLRGQGVRKAQTTRRVSKEVHFAENYGFRVTKTRAGFETLVAELEPSDTWKAGYEAAQKALPAARKSGRKRARPQTLFPSREDQQRYRDCWQEFLNGWAAGIAELRERELTWEQDA